MIFARWIRLEQDCRGALRTAVGGFAQAQPARAVPAVFWAHDDEGGYAYAFVVPLRLVPGRPWRWRAWALAPAIATYRQFGERAYLDGDDVWLSGRRIAASEAATAGDCAVVVSGFAPRSPGTLADWVERELEAAFRGRIEAQHGWEFENSWPTETERLAITDALSVEGADAS
ncbi:MAG: hypothetical protein ABI654_13955 [Betaproteobacteria bacterium]